MTEFVDFINEIAPNYQIPCRQTITKRLIPEKIDILKAQIKHELNQINWCALSTDVWTSNSMMMLSYLSVTREWEKEDKVFKIVSDSGAYIKSCAICLFNENYFIQCSAHRLNLWIDYTLEPRLVKTKMDNEENTRYYVRDFNENCEIRKIKINNETLEEIEHLNEMKDEINRILGKCKKLVGSFKYSEFLSRRLKEKQEALNFSTRIKLVQDCPTR
ncbi:unnamed protein product [Brachionus calyciflorus]|uniref:Uncharacterized protein n=1 Tax=Brachionus calyciflorus TaxID=104777 RepID=A0A814FRC8_9BILA|nr:unnamed protein product [Brachionus calyciflorus]